MGASRLFAGRSAVVVGGSRGIGRAVAVLLAEHGASVVVNGRGEDAVGDTVAAISERGHRAVGHVGSAAEPDVADALIVRSVAEHGGIDILVNCAGVAGPPGSSILNVTSGEFAALLDAHLGTVFQTCRAAAPRMVAQGGGAIVNTSSFAFLGHYGGTGYPAGKGAVNSLTFAIAAELNEHGVRANVVCPGARTRLSTGASYEQHIVDLHRRGLLDDISKQAALDPAPPDYVAPTYAYLASELAAGVTGQIFAAAGNFVGRYKRQTPDVLGYRDHNGSPPWTVEEVDEMVRKADSNRVKKARLV